ncbi:hypothetical protein HNQ36_004306 [Afipia massiliensis]|uniref:Uncharacterized protein n=1 Tax=Afipia massiliensis TaxID=211460 RepID=A0A840N6U4_9BRAD|nr:hypothetical protein [Afipia massiliensis]MBB5054304.1 hypothetical protein [Afipia massiliensis]
MTSRVFGAALLSFSFLCTPSMAAEPVLGMGIGHPRKTTELGDRRIYQITFECKKLADPTSDPVANAFIRRNKSNSHLIVIADELPARDPATDKLKFSDKAVALLPVFSVRNGRLDPDNREACPNDTYVYGGRKLYVLGIASFSTTNTPGWLTSLTYGVAGLVPPLWSMFKGNISPEVSSKLGKYEETEDPLKKTLSALNADENYSLTQELGADRYVVQTAFSRVTIRVKYIRSILRDGTQTARNAFRKQLDGGEELSTTDIAATCSKIAAELLKLGFSNEEDVPFGLGYKAINSKLTVGQITECLGSDYALAAANMKDLQSFAPKSRRLDPKKVAEQFPPADSSVEYQPEYRVNQANTEKFNRALATVTRAKDVVAADQAKLNNLLASTFVLQDETVAKVFGGSSITGGDAVVKAMIDAGYRRFGCHQSTELGKSADGGTTLLFAFKADADNKTLPIESVVILKPFFASNKVTKVIAYDEYDWINTVMESRGYACYGTKIEKPPGEQKVAAGPRGG